MSQLDNKTIVIIGGTTGLGLAAAKAFVREGARVLVVGRNADSVSQAESTMLAELISGDNTAELVEDVLWAVTMLPEFQLVY